MDPRPSDPLRGLYDAHGEALRELERWQTIVDDIEARIKALIGDRPEVRRDGQLLYTYKHTGNFSPTQFKQRYPLLYEKYLVTKTTQVIDRERLAKDHPELYTSLRSRVFLRK